MTTTNLMSKSNLPKAVVLAVEEAKDRSKRESIEIAQCQEGITEHQIAADSIRSVKVRNLLQCGRPWHLSFAFL